MVPATRARSCRLTLIALLLIALGGLLLATVGGCSAAAAPHGGERETSDGPNLAPDAGDPPAPPSTPERGPPRVAVTADARTVLEGEPATFTVAAAGASSRDPIVVDYVVAGTARAAADYHVPDGSTTIDAGVSLAKVTITTLSDNEPEPLETIELALTRASTATGTVEVDTTPATVNIAEPGTPIVSVAPASAREGEPAAFVVTVSGTQSGMTVAWKTVDETAAAGADYTAETNGTVVFGSGSPRRQTIRVATLQDRLDEDEEIFAVHLTGVSPASAASLGRATAIGTITDDDDLPVLTIADGEAAEDAGSMAFRVLLTPASGRQVTVFYRTGAVTATAGSDYTEKDGRLLFTPGGPLAQDVRIAISEDRDDEEDEEFTVRLYSPVHATLGDAEATGTITDNDDSGQPIIGGLPRLDVADSRANEGDGVMLFTVTLNRPSAEAVSVFYETNDGTAQTHPASDYTKTEGELVFSAGATLRQSIVVPILQDDLDEGTGETFTVQLLDPVNAVLGDDTATGLIVDDDAPTDDHGSTRATATAITQGSPTSGRLETAADIDFFKVAVTASLDVITATDEGRVGDPGYPASTVVRIEGGGYTSTNNDSFDAASVDLGGDASAEVYVRVSGASATRYELAVWLLDRDESDMSFDIELRYLNPDTTAAQKAVFRAAADVWESIITGDLSRRIVLDSDWECEDGDPSAFGDTVDDLRIDIRLQKMDGLFGTLAVAGPCVWRPGSLPMIGDASFDNDDWPTLGAAGQLRVAVHEMAHVLGYGTTLQWHHLLRNSALDHLENNPGDTTLPDTHFAGQASRTAFDEVGGSSYSGGGKVPVENNTADYGPGGLDGHWREAVFGNELMIGTIYLDSRTSQPLSKVTIAAMADLGYRVDLTKAESYSLPSTSQSLLRLQSAQDRLYLGDHIRRGPVIVAEIPE